METEQRPDAVHAALRGLLAELIGPVATGGDPEAAAELTEMLNTVFGVALTVETVMSVPSPGQLASAIEAAWFEAGGTAEELGDRVAALTEDE
jgi:hypothetical protein